MLTIDELKQTHTTYGQTARTWDYLSRSYAGGNIWREAGYLRKYLGEDEAPGNQYAQRLISTALDNQVQNVVSIYRSYIFKSEPMRSVGSAEDQYGVEEFMDDCDLDGSDIDDFMRYVNDQLAVFGVVWIAVDRPAYQAQTLAEEQALGIRPYATLYTPLQVLDWQQERDIAGRYNLTYVKIREASFDDYDIIRVWRPDTVEEYKVKKQKRPQFVSTGNGINNQPVLEEIHMDYETILEYSEYINPLGRVPVVIGYNQKKVKTGLGISDVYDVADQQRMIYNLCSELEQNIRISAHPSLVKPGDVDAAAGAGAVINMPDNMDPNLKPYLLQPTAATVDSILNAIEYHQKCIDNMTNLNCVRGTQQAQSGVALEAEFLLLNTRLADKAANLEKIEYKIWQLFFEWCQTDMPEDFDIEYEDSFSIRDEQRDLTMLQTGLAAVDNAEYQLEAKKRIVRITIDDDTEIEAIEAAMEDEYLAAQAAAEVSVETTSTTADTTEALQPGPAASPEGGSACPIATQDIPTNLKNRQTAIDRAHYGPLNPNQPNRVYWMNKAAMFGSTVAEAKTSRCSNCSMFNQTQAILDCIDSGIAAGGSGRADAWDTINAGNLGYCEAFDFKCAGNRTCDAWVAGGPITD